ncbi:MAG: helicase [Gammaproteobacteria bacterium]|nr:helicase [Gammaproteobacteria bacterium]
MFEFQRDITAWALKKGRACIFADCGLGKTLMQLEWGRCVPGDVLILAPLSVSHQTCSEAAKFGIADVTYSGDGGKTGKITITNYERVSKFDLSQYAGLILDESSILKSYDGKFRTDILESAAGVPFRLACTATPAPNDFMELGNHAEFVGSMTREEMLSMFFIHDGGETQKWRIKGHAKTEFWEWVCSWAVMIRKPSDLGYSDDGFNLPRLDIQQHSVEHCVIDDGFLFAMEAQRLKDRQAARKNSIADRVAEIARLANSNDEQWLVWCNLNAESEAATKAIAGAVEVSGADSDEAKGAAMSGFAAGEVRVLVTKPKIAGFGMNWQHCRNVAFLGLSDSYEQYYQAIRRCWRFGQKNTVNCHIVTSEAEGAVVRNIERKENEAMEMAMQMVENMKTINREEVRGMKREQTEYAVKVESGEGWKFINGDSCEQLPLVEPDSIGYSIFSPPFASLYTYSNSDRDLGNCKGDDEFADHFRFIVEQLYRVLMPGRCVSFHCTNLPMMKTHHGYIGIRDFRGDMIRLFESCGFIFHSEVCIWKDPVTAMQRTKAIGLLHKQVVKDSAMSRQGIPDYLVTMRKPGENAQPIAGEFDHFAGVNFKPTGRLSIDIWQRYASPVWMDINATRTLQYMSARDNDDERHICPLQLDVIHRGLQMWSNEGDLILTPFGGIGSEGYEAVRLRRRALLIELKESYWKVGVRNMQDAESEVKQDMLF